jgi:hypothetical protein
MLRTAVAAMAGATATAAVLVARRNQGPASPADTADTATVVSGLRRLAAQLEAGNPIAKALAVRGDRSAAIPPGLWQAAAAFADPEDPDGLKATAGIVPAAVEVESIASLRASGRIQGDVTIAGTVIGVDERLNRAKNRSASITVDDGTGTITIQLFPKHWHRVTSGLRAGSHLTVSGRLNHAAQGLEVHGHGPESPAWQLEP